MPSERERVRKLIEEYERDRAALGQTPLRGVPDFQSLRATAPADVSRRVPSPPVRPFPGFRGEARQLRDLAVEVGGKFFEGIPELVRKAPYVGEGAAKWLELLGRLGFAIPSGLAAGAEQSARQPVHPAMLNIPALRAIIEQTAATAIGEPVGLQKPQPRGVGGAGAAVLNPILRQIAPGTLGDQPIGSGLQFLGDILGFRLGMKPISETAKAVKRTWLGTSEAGLARGRKLDKAKEAQSQMFAPERPAEPARPAPTVPPSAEPTLPPEFVEAYEAPPKPALPPEIPIEARRSVPVEQQKALFEAAKAGGMTAKDLLVLSRKTLGRPLKFTGEKGITAEELEAVKLRLGERLPDVAIEHKVIVEPPDLPPGTPPPMGRVTRDFAEQIPNYQDISAFEAGTYSFSNPLNVVRRIEPPSKVARVADTEMGPFEVNAMHPVMDADVIRQKELYRLAQEETALIKKIPVARRVAWYKIPGAKLIRGAQEYNELYQVFLATENRATRPLTQAGRALQQFYERVYEETRQRKNEARAVVGLPEIPKLPNYIFHGWETSIIEDLYGHDPIVREAMIQGTGRGKTHFDPSALKRYGKEGFVEDAHWAFANSLPTRLSVIHMTEPVARARAYVAQLPKNAKTYFSSWLDQGGLGRMNTIDKEVPFFVKGALPKMAWRVARNIIDYNLNVAVRQFSSIPTTLAEVGIYHGVNAMVGSFVPSNWRYANKHSQVLQLRKYTKYEDIGGLPDVLQKAITVGETPLRFADQMTVRWAFQAAHDAAIRRGLAPAEAIRVADSFAGRTQAIYGRLYKAPIMRSVSFANTLGTFQSWTFAQANHIGYDILFNKELSGWQKGKRITKLVGTAIAVNQIFNMLGLPTPFPGIGSAIPLFDEMPDKVKNLPGMGGQEIAGRASESPVVNEYVNLGRDLLKLMMLPIPKSVLKVASGALQTAIPGAPEIKPLTPAERYKTLRYDIPRDLSLIVPKRGGLQIHRSAEGLLGAVLGKAQIPVRGKMKTIPIRTPREKIEAILRGPTGTARARQLYRGRDVPQKDSPEWHRMKREVDKIIAEYER